jgi:hypothetical protein
MDSQQAHSAVMVSLVVMLGYGLVSGKGKQIGTYKQIWAIGALGLVLSLVADVAPAVGGWLAILFSLGFVAGGQAKMNQVIENAIGKAPVNTGYGASGSTGGVHT